MVVCPSIGRPGGTGVRSLGWQWCCGLAIVCPSSAPLHFSLLRSLYFLTAPLPSRVLLWRSSPWPLIAMGAVELAPLPSPGFFYSRLFAMWLSSGSWRPVMTLSHLLCFCDSVSISDGAHSVCAPVSMSGDWMAYLVLRAAFLQVLVHPASRHLLPPSSSETLFIYSRLSALSFPWLHWSSPGSWLLFPPFSPLYFSA